MPTLDFITAILAVLLGLAFVGYLIHHGIVGEPERDAEERAREFFTEHGHWPDEAP